MDEKKNKLSSYRSPSTRLRKGITFTAALMLILITAAGCQTSSSATSNGSVVNAFCALYAPVTMTRGERDMLSAQTLIQVHRNNALWLEMCNDSVSGHRS